MFGDRRGYNSSLPPAFAKCILPVLGKGIPGEELFPVWKASALTSSGKPGFSLAFTGPTDVPAVIVSISTASL